MLTAGALRGEQVVLTGIDEDDLATLLPWHNDIDYGRYLSRGTPSFVTEKDLRGWMLEGDDARYTVYPRPMGIRLIGDKTLIGVCGYKEVQWYANHTMLWMGIGNRDERGKGYGTDALKIMLRYAFREMNMNRVALEVADFNAPARRSYEKCGFQLEGTLRQYMYREGRYWDMHLMALLRDDWEAMQSESA